MSTPKRKIFLDSLVDDCSMDDLMYLKEKIERLMNRREEEEVPIPAATPVDAVMERLVDVEKKTELKTPTKATKSVTNFYAIHGRVELCEIDGEKREMKVIGKTENELATMARDPRNGSLYAIDRASLLQIDPSKGKVRHVATIKCQNVPVRSIRGLCFSPSGEDAYCVALKGTIKKVNRGGDAICRINMKTGNLIPEVVIQLSDIVGLSVETKSSWLVWSSYEGLLRVTKSSLDAVSAKPVGISIRSLSANENGDLFGIGDRLYEIELSRGDDGAVNKAVVEPMTGALPVSCDGLVCRPSTEGFFSPSMKSPPEMRQDNDYVSPAVRDRQVTPRPVPQAMEFSASEWNTPVMSNGRQFHGKLNSSSSRHGTTLSSKRESSSSNSKPSFSRSSHDTSSGRRRKPVAFVV